MTPDPQKPAVLIDDRNANHLLEQLRAGVTSESLSVPNGSELPHLGALKSYFFETDPAQRAKWAECLFMLIALKAPADSGKRSIAKVLTFADWNATPELTERLVNAYLAAGMFNPHSPMSGTLGDVDTAFGTHCGKTPLASAIGQDNAAAVRFLCDLGVSWNIGKVMKGGFDAKPSSTPSRSPSPQSWPPSPNP